jgi:hypothetical protein
MLVGCDDFLLKPIEIKKLIDLLQQHLNLKWVYGQALAGEAVPLPEPDQTGEITPPPPAEIVILFDLAMKGEILHLRQRAVQIAQMGHEFQPFASLLEKLTNDYEEDQILKLVKRYM